MYESNGTSFILRTRVQTVREQDSTHTTLQSTDLKGVEIFAHDVAKLGVSVLLRLLVASQTLPDALPQDDHDLQQTGDDVHVLPQNIVLFLLGRNCALVLSGHTLLTVNGDVIVPYLTVLLVIHHALLAAALYVCVQNAANGQHQVHWKTTIGTLKLTFNTCDVSKRPPLTYVSGTCVYVDVLVELSGGHRVHLDQGDAPPAPLCCGLVGGEEGLEEQVDDALRDTLCVHSEASEQVVRVAHVPKLERRARGRKGEEKHLKVSICVQSESDSENIVTSTGWSWDREYE